MKTIVKRLVGIALTLVILAAGGLGSYEVWTYYMLSPWTRDARVRADVVTIAPDVAGFVTDLRVRDNQVVHKGEILLVIDQARYKLAVATAEANLAARYAEMLMRQSEAQRRTKLTNLAISDEAKEDSQHVAASAVGAYQQALADLATAKLNLERTVVRAPVNGYVTNLGLVVGQYAAVGTRLLALIDSDSYRVEGYFEETKMPGVALGSPVEIHLMSGGPALKGHVESISRGITDRDNPDGPQLLANVTPTFEWVRLAQRIPTRIHIDSVPDGVLVSSGMTCTVVVEGAAARPELLSMFRNKLGG
ncbi:MAG: efflux RND transporter periplasmic adaptor subunit [Alphaproteobacteria bacterium]|nr:efflux RND transporter periplasmic adaptor subunit [Alphaproteobacteria bacterium]MBV8407940.1 efflux RND transporter periplasmic adaptor subunit [Alphaproteobacteria bacterium]